MTGEASSAWPLSDLEADVLLAVPYSYVSRPRPVPADLRPLWRVPYVLLLVRACRGMRATLSQLHVLNWAVRSAANAEALDGFMRGEVEVHDAVVRYEPALDRAVSLAVGFSFLRFEGRLWRLEPAGLDLLKRIDRDEVLFTLEQDRLASVSGLTQAAVARLLGRAS